MGNRRIRIWKKVTAEVIEKNRYLVTVEVEDNATDGDIYDAIVRAYIGDDTYMGDSCKVIEQYIYDVTNIKVKEKWLKNINGLEIHIWQI